MGVHNADYKKIKKLLEIPEDEPIFIFRGQDDLAAAIITRYLNMARQIEDDDKRPSSEWFDQLEGEIARFIHYRNLRPERIKVPD